MSDGHLHHVKRRGSERRREKSRVAARCRRNKEAEIFSGLVRELPREFMSSYNNGQLDKASIMRLTLSSIKLDKMVKGAKEAESAYDSCCLEACDGFLIVLTADNEIVYISRNVLSQLGLPHVDFMGQSLIQFVHPCDGPKLQRMLENGRNGTVDMCVRVKSACAAKKNNGNTSYEVIHCRASALRKEDDQSLQGMLLLCQVMPEAGNMYEVLSSSDVNKSFVSRHRMNMKIINCDQHIENLLGYDTEEMVDRSLYELCHAGDIEIIGKSFKQLFTLGKIRTEPYRLMARNGGYVWLVTTACVCYEKVTGEAYGVKCLHELVGGIEDEDEIVDVSQQTPSIKPKFNTESVFCPLKEIVEVEIRTTEHEAAPEGLVTLAPHAGETCVTLDFPAEIRMETEDYCEILPQQDMMSQHEMIPQQKILQQQLLTVDTGYVSPQGPLSPAYPPSEGFAAEEAAQLSPYSSPYPYAGTAPQFVYNRFSPLPDRTTCDCYNISPQEKLEWSLPFAMHEDPTTLAPFIDDRQSFYNIEEVENPPFYENLPFTNPMKCSTLCTSSCTGKRLIDLPSPNHVRQLDFDTQKPLPQPSSSNSALMNLLRFGDGLNYGKGSASLVAAAQAANSARTYRKEEPPGYPMVDKERLSLPIVTTHDAEVNVPVPKAGLLTGQALLEALEYDCNG